MGSKPLLNSGHKRSADGHTHIALEDDKGFLPVRVHTFHARLRYPPAAVHLSTELRIEQRNRVGHPHQDETATSTSMDAQIMILGFECYNVAPDVRRKFSQQRGRERERL